MITLTKKALILALGWTFIFLGFIGLFLPFLQGILFMIIGLAILSKESTMARNLMARLKKKHPRPFQVASEWRRRFSERYHRWVGR
jgi:uncharacterized membrane protein YbaN (DUF454 family)